MNKYKIYSILFSAVLILLSIGCSDDKLDEVGEDVNNPTVVTNKLLIAQVVAEAAFTTAGTDLAWYSSVFVEHTTGVHGQLETADKRTAINSTIGNNSWNTLYNTLRDLKIIVDQGSEGGTEEGDWISVGIAKILMAYNISVATDLWGEVPFSEAMQGNEIREPVFDTEEEVYTAIFNLLNEAIVDLQRPTELTPGASDFIYGGDPDLWIKAAYAYKARFFNRLSNVGPAAYADSVIACAALSFAGPGEGLIFNAFGTDSKAQNPWFQEEADRGHHSLSETFNDILLDLNDPRRELLIDTIDGGVIVPAPNGTAQNDQAGTLYSKFKYSYLNEVTPMPLITYEEVKFLEAEAYLRLNDNVAADSSYIEAVRTSMASEGVPAGDINTYIAQSDVQPGAAGLTEEHIITQKYIHFWVFNPIEAYNDYRRTGIPVMNNPISDPPSRFPYPVDEAAANTNMPDRDMFDLVWWALY